MPEAPVLPCRGPVALREQAPVSAMPCGDGTWLIDYGRVAFANVSIHAPLDMEGADVVFHFGEALAEGRIDRQPPGSVRYAAVKVRVSGGATMVVAPAPDDRNTRHPSAVRTPEAWGVLIPFRWLEVEGWKGPMEASRFMRRAAFQEGWRDDAASFVSSDPMLDRIWDLCRYTIKAATFSGVYVDGDRERIAYEADAHIQQLGHYALDPDLRMARCTFDQLARFPTWPTEWSHHMILMAHADWMQTGDTAWFADRYDWLKTKLLPGRTRADGLLASYSEHIEKGDLVDWPGDERDGFVFTQVNTVVNAFHIHALRLIAMLARAMRRTEEAERFELHRARALAAFHERLFDEGKRLFRDGEGTGHCSLHANLFPLAFGLVPEAYANHVASWLAGRGMACSPYAAHYLLEGLFLHGQDRAAIALMNAPGDRSWRHMVDSGATMTWEAWDVRYKANMDWNHPWATAPAHLLPRHVLGVQAERPGWSQARIRPCPGGLLHAEGRVSTPLGPVEIDWTDDHGFCLRVALPPGMRARIEVPVRDGYERLHANGQPVDAVLRGDRWVLGPVLAGEAIVILS